jgi:3-phenylpropionate/trans-cinnamate dioxygenase ferredoxin reductase subunit
MTDVLIVGAGQAGASAAIALRQGGFDGDITIAGAEGDLPYERPPLSKEYLAGEKPLERLLLRPAAFWAERQVRIRTGTRIAAIDPGARTATAETGDTLPYDHLVWAAGGEARRLAIPGAEHAHVIRTRADTDRLRAALGRMSRIAIIGGGYIGLEAAAVLTKLGHRVTILEAQDRLLARVAGPEVSAFYRSEHEAHGVSIRLRVAPEAIEPDAVRLSSGERIPADLVIAGVGLVPNVGPLAAAGAPCPNGVLVDAHCRTTLPGVYAIGDCALHESDFAGGARVRIESVQNASDMGKAAAAHILSGDAAPPYRALPWFWSNQYDLKLQTVGLSAGADTRVVRGDPGSRSWSLVYLRAGAVVALDCINAPKDYMGGRALIERRAHPSPALLADPSMPLKSLEG